MATTRKTLVTTGTLVTLVPSEASSTPTLACYGAGVCLCSLAVTVTELSFCQVGVPVTVKDLRLGPSVSPVVPYARQSLEKAL